VPAAWPYVNFGKLNYTILADGVTTCSVNLVPMGEYLLAGWHSNFILEKKKWDYS
jgi:hypothetical protein